MMTEQNEAKNAVLRYLLGQMSDAERSSFEEQYQKDTGLFDELAEVENDLIDLYALGALSKSEQEQMRSFLADPDRQKRLVFATTLARYPDPRLESVRSSVPESSGGWSSWHRSKRYAMPAMAAVAAIVMIIGISWLFVVNRRLNRERETVRFEYANAQKNEQALQQQLDTLRREVQDHGKSPKDLEQSPVLAQNTILFSPRSDVVRGDGPTPTFAIPSSAVFVVFNLTVSPASSSGYDLFLETADGNPVWHKESVSGSLVAGVNTHLTAKLRSRVLTDGDYVLRVTTTDNKKTEDVAGYSFRVVHR